MDMEQIDENDAPEGYRAVGSPSDCMGCAFVGDAKGCINAVECGALYRSDGQMVIFVKREQSSQESFDAGMRKALADYGFKNAHKHGGAADAIRHFLERRRNWLESMRGSIHTEVPTTPVRPMDSDMPGINRAEKIHSWEMQAERVTEPAKPVTPAGLCVVAEQSHRFGGYGA